VIQGVGDDRRDKKWVIRSQAVFEVNPTLFYLKLHTKAGVLLQQANIEDGTILPMRNNTSIEAQV